MFFMKRLFLTFIFCLIMSFSAFAEPTIYIDDEPVEPTYTSPLDLIKLGVGVLVDYPLDKFNEVCEYAYNQLDSLFLISDENGNVRLDDKTIADISTAVAQHNGNWYPYEFRGNALFNGSYINPVVLSSAEFFYCDTYNGRYNYVSYHTDSGYYLSCDSLDSISFNYVPVSGSYTSYTGNPYNLMAYATAYNTYPSGPIGINGWNALRNGYSATYFSTSPSMQYICLGAPDTSFNAFHVPNDLLTQYRPLSDFHADYNTWITNKYDDSLTINNVYNYYSDYTVPVPLPQSTPTPTPIPYSPDAIYSGIGNDIDNINSNGFHHYSFNNSGMQFITACFYSLPLSVQNLIFIGLTLTCATLLIGTVSYVAKRRH